MLKNPTTLPPIIRDKITQAILTDNSLTMLSQVIVKTMLSAFMVPDGKYLDLLRKKIREEIANNLRTSISKTSKFPIPENELTKIVKFIDDEFLNTPKVEAFIGKLISKQLLSSTLTPIKAIYYLMRKITYYDLESKNCDAKLLLQISEKRINFFKEHFSASNAQLGFADHFIHQNMFDAKIYLSLAKQNRVSFCYFTACFILTFMLFALAFIFLAPPELYWHYVILATFSVGVPLAIVLGGNLKNQLHYNGVDIKETMENYVKEMLVDRMPKGLKLSFPAIENQKTDNSQLQKPKKTNVGTDTAVDEIYQSYNPEPSLKAQFRQAEKEMAQDKQVEDTKPIENSQQIQAVKVQKIKWQYNDKAIIYHPLRDIFKIIELLTLDPTKKSLNHRYYIYWDEPKIKKILGKLYNVLYPIIYRVGQIGQIGNFFNDQGYIKCEEEKKIECFKLKTLAANCSHYRLHFFEMARTKLSTDGELLQNEATIFGAAKLTNTN